MVSYTAERAKSRVNCSHIVSDGWSMGVLVGELNALYGAFLGGEADPLPELEIQYADYAVWQRQWIEGEILQQQAAYWKTTLAGAPALLELPTDHTRPVQWDFAGGFVELVLDEQLTAGLKGLSDCQGALSLLQPTGICCPPITQPLLRLYSSDLRNHLARQ